jgi:peptidoglycan/LPS O-acetylase OafA/YrhL
MTSVATSTPPELPPIVDAKRLPALDGLRGIAILLVLVHHLLYRLRLCPGFVHYLVAAGGLSWSGVDLFFVLSGFLIGGILLDARNSPRYYRTFYARRAFRILPIYLVLLGLCTVRYIPLSWSASRLGGFSRMEIPWIAYLTLTQNFWMAVLGSWGLGTLTPTWSLAVEEQFYLTVPTIIRKVGQHRLVALLLVVTASAPIFRALLQHFGQPNGIAVYVLMPSRADALSCGILCAILLRHRYWKSLVSRRHLLWGLFGMLLVGMLALTYEQVNPFVGRGSRFSIRSSAFFMPPYCCSHFRIPGRS